MKDISYISVDLDRRLLVTKFDPLRFVVLFRDCQAGLLRELIRDEDVTYVPHISKMARAAGKRNILGDCGVSHFLSGVMPPHVVTGRHDIPRLDM
jgi:hypothetical protein